MRAKVSTGFLPTILAIVAAATIAGAASAQTTEEAQPKTHAHTLTVHYTFEINGIQGAKVADTLTIDEQGNYRIDRLAAAVGLAKIMHGDVINSSEGKITDYGLQMSTYHQKRGSRPPQTANYNGETLNLTRGEGNTPETQTAAIPPPLYDYLTIIYSHYIAGRIITGTITQTDGWRIRTYTYEAGEEETIETPTGETTAIPITYKSNRGPRIFWLSPKLGYLPIQSIIEDKGIKFQTTMIPTP